VLSAGYDLLQVNDVASGQLLADMLEKKNYIDINTARFSPDGRYIASHFHNRLVIWNCEAGKWVNNFDGTGHTATINALDWSPTARLICTAGADGTIRLFKSDTGAAITDFAGAGHAGPVTAIRFSPDGKYIASGGADGRLIIWSLENILGSVWQTHYADAPLFTPVVMFSKEILAGLAGRNRERLTGDSPVARCGECGGLFEVEPGSAGKEISCPVEISSGRPCGRRLRLEEKMPGMSEQQ
jgi:WD40 repeat protein